MRTRVVRAEEPDVIEQALAVWQAGGLVVFPTDTVYGLSALPASTEALRRMWRIKGRDNGAFIALLLADPEELPRFATLPEAVRPLAQHFWPGPVTLMLPRTEAVPPEIGEGPRVGIRVPALPLARTLIRAAGGALAVTSANLPGHPAARNAQEVLAQLGSQIDLVIDGGWVSIGAASTVVDCTRWPPVVVREGPISEADIRGVLGLIRREGSR
ncbi:MAG: threonylcarbamoyl-AMP synthase [Thermoflexales bacterium]|nr:threonylcarbamoyl-AMP synthase [Thermoflexales bacterium]